METKKPTIPDSLQCFHHRTKIILRVILISLVVILGIFLVYTKLFPRANYYNSEYGFALTKLNNWKQIPPKDGAFVSFAILKGNTVVSYADIRPLKKSANKNFSREQARKNCDEIEKEVKGQKANFIEAVINNSSGYRCTIETEGQNTQQILLIIQYTLTAQSGNEYLYVLSASYPRDNLNQKHHVEDLISSFIIL